MSARGSPALSITVSKGRETLAKDLAGPPSSHPTPPKLVFCLGKAALSQISGHRQPPASLPEWACVDLMVSTPSTQRRPFGPVSPDPPKLVGPWPFLCLVVSSWRSLFLCLFSSGPLSTFGRQRTPYSIITFWPRSLSLRFFFPRLVILLMSELGLGLATL